MLEVYYFQAYWRSRATNDARRGKSFVQPNRSA